MDEESQRKKIMAGKGGGLRRGDCYCISTIEMIIPGTLPSGEIEVKSTLIF